MNLTFRLLNSLNTFIPIFSIILSKLVSKYMNCYMIIITLFVIFVTYSGFEMAGWLYYEKVWKKIVMDMRIKILNLWKDVAFDRTSGPRFLAAEASIFTSETPSITPFCFSSERKSSLIIILKISSSSS